MNGNVQVSFHFCQILDGQAELNPSSYEYLKNKMRHKVKTKKILISKSMCIYNDITSLIYRCSKSPLKIISDIGQKT